MVIVKENGVACGVLVASIMPSVNNKRLINDALLKDGDLYKSIASSGVQVPVHVRTTATAEKYELIAGERRWRVCKLLKYDMIPAIVHTNMSDADAFALTFAENFAREDLTALEEEKAVGLIVEQTGGDIRAAASKLGWTEKQVRLRLKLADLHPDWRALVEKPMEHGGFSPVSTWSAAHLGVIARFPKETQARILKTSYVANTEGRHISVSSLEDSLEDFLQLLRGAKWDLTDPTVLRKAGACLKCEKRSSCQNSLFNMPTDVPVEKNKVHPDDKCLDPTCWNKKQKSWLRTKEKKLREKHPDLVKITQSWGSSSGVLKSHQFDKCKREGKGAVPAMDTASGALSWIKINDNGNRSLNNAEQAKKEKEKAAKPKTLKQLRTELEELRAKNFEEKMYRGLRTFDEKKPSVKDKELQKLLGVKKLNHRGILQLSILFGVGGVLHWNDKIPPKAKEVTAMSESALMEAFWMQSLQGVLDGINNSTDARDAAVVLGLDCKKIDAQIAKELPEPKEWANLKADGTPTGAPAKKKAGNQTPVKRKISKKKTAKK